MRAFFTGFGLQLKRLLRSRATLACLLAAPLLTLALCLALPKTGGQGNPVRVGVCFEGSSPAADALWRRLQGSGGGDIRFELAGTAAELEETVAAGAWECGYLVPSGLDERLRTGRYARLFTRVEGGHTTMADLVDWMVTASLLDVCAPDIALEVLAAAGREGAGSGALEQAAFAAFGTASLMDFKVVAAGGQAVPAGGSATLTGLALVRGVVALLLLLFCCLGAVRFAGDITGGFFARLRPATGLAGLYLPGWAATALLGGIMGGGCLGIAALFYPGAFTGFGREAASLFSYLLLLAGFAFLLAMAIPRQAVLLGLLPYLTVLCLLFCPILIDLSGFIPGGRAIAGLLPPTLYLRAAGGQNLPFWQMPAAGVVLFAAGFLLARLHSHIKHR